MTSRFTLRLIAAATFGTLLVSGALAADLPPQFDPSTMIPVSEVKVGMKGVSKSVFRGVEIHEFGVEVVGILPKEDLGGDLVLIKVLDGPVVDRDCGIIGGMSGSPVYFDGRLLGAVAYTFSFEKEPIGGVTPMASMLHAYVDPTAKQEETARHEPVELHGRRLTSARIAPMSETEPFADADTINMKPVGLMSVSGMTRRGLRDFGELLEPYGIRPVAGPGTMEEAVDADLVPGAGIAVELMRGDFSSSLIGTVTWREGDTLLAFGHPFMQLGAVDMPMATAFIHDFVPSYDRTDKFGSGMEMVGSLRRDGTWAVGGLMGPVPDMVPVDITVMDETTGKRRAFHVEVAKEPLLTQQLISSAVANAVDSSFKPIGEGMAKVKFTIEGERGAKVERENIYWNRMSIAGACTREVGSTIYVLRRNPFDPQEPARVSMEVTLSDKNISAAIEEVYTDETVAKAGEKLTVHVVLRPWDGDTFEKVIVLDLPEDLKRGTMRIGVGGGEGAYSMRSRLGLLQPDFHDLPSIIEDMENVENNDQLFVGAALPNTGIGIAEYLLHKLPSSILKVMSSSRTTDVRGGREEISVLLDTDFVILGASYLTLGTEDKTGARASTPPPTSGATPPPAPPPARVSVAGSFGPETRVNPLTAPPLEWATARLSRTWPGTTLSNALATQGPPGKNGKKGKKPVKPPAPTSDDDDDEDDDDDDGALTRKLAEWRQTSGKDFAEGEAKGIAIRSDGTLYVAEKKVRDWQTQEHREIWSIVADEDGTAYLGMGKDGQIYKAVGDADPELLHETGELAVHALALSGGSLYAGTIPDGKLIKLDPANPEGAEVVADWPDQYIWALAPAPDGGVYAGTGSAGRIYHVSAAGEAKLLADLPAQHVLCLAMLGDDLLAGTAENGVVFQVSADGSFEAVYDDEDPAITGVAVTESGEAYACSSPKGNIARITPGKPSNSVVKLDADGALCMTAVGDSVYVGTTDDGKIISILSPEKYAVIAETEGSEVACLAAAGNRLLAGAANPGRLTVFDGAVQSSGTFESAVLDAKRASRWATVLWTGEKPDGGAIEVRSRVGATADPEDGTWSAWSYPYAMAKAQKIAGADARYLQYRVQVDKADNGESPLFDGLLLKYLPANQKPTLKVTAPEPGAAISGEFKFKFEGKDEDEDKLRYSVAVRASGADEWEVLKEDIKDTDYEWDTTEDVDEGVYTARIIATDGLSNPMAPLSVEELIFPVLVDNTPPALRDSPDPEVGEDKTVLITGRASDGGSQIVSIEYRIGDDGEWKTIAPSDGLLDSHGEAFELRTAALEPGQKVITIRIRDAAGNKDDTKVTAVIPGEEKEEAGEEGDETEEDDKDDEETDETEEDDEEEKDDAETE